MQMGDKVVETSQFMQIYRSREVGQSYITSVWTTLVALAHGLWLMIKIRPEVVTFYPHSFLSSSCCFVVLDMFVLTVHYQHFVILDSLQWSRDLCSTLHNHLLI